MPGITSSAMKDPTAYLTPNNISKMIHNEPDLRNKVIIRLLFRGGMRTSELCGIKVSNILWNENCIVIPWLKRRVKEGESQRIRKIPVDSGTLSLIKDYLEWRKRWHTSGNSGDRLIPIGRKMVYWIVRRAAERVGIHAVGSPDNPHHPHPHTLRHSYATWRVSQTNGDYNKLRKVQLDMGHADINTTASYLAVSGEELHREYDEAFEGLD